MKILYKVIKVFKAVIKFLVAIFYWLLVKPFKCVFRKQLNNRKGKKGESKVNRKLNPIIGKKTPHRLINDLYLLDENQKSHQIDHIEIRTNGVFCIETKNYSGQIYGGENQKTWTQVLSNGEKNQFVNPLNQNKAHIYHLNRILEGKYKINSLVVMVQDNSSQVFCSNVIDLSDLIEYLNDYNDGVILTTEEIDEIYNKIINASADITNKEHVKNIEETQKGLKNGICPRCGAKLIVRKGKYGDFFGCSNYPKCKFTYRGK